MRLSEAPGVHALRASLLGAPGQAQPDAPSRGAAFVGSEDSEDSVTREMSPEQRQPAAQYRKHSRSDQVELLPLVQKPAFEHLAGFLN